MRRGRLRALHYWQSDSGRTEARRVDRWEPWVEPRGQVGRLRSTHDWRHFTPSLREALAVVETKSKLAVHDASRQHARALRLREGEGAGERGQHMSGRSGPTAD